MNAMALAPATKLICWCGTAQAYCPFDGTDAAVADTREIEIELARPNIFAKVPSACSLLLI
jgi:hypothetical protein